MNDKRATGGAGGFQSQAIKSTMTFLLWTFVWTTSHVLIDKSALHGWLPSANTTAAAIALSTLLGAGMIWAFIRHLNTMDELQQKIQLQALGFALGITLVGCFTYSLLITSGFILEPELNDIILLLVVSYVVAVIIGQVRYR